MANLNCCWKSSGAHQWRVHITRSGKDLALRYAIGLAVVIFGASMQAAQITFAFEATVTDVLASSGAANLLPFEPMVGQNMSGSVTFTPVPFGQTSDNDAMLHVTWQGETFTALSHKLQTVNDYPVSPGFPYDALGVVCGVSENCATGSPSALIRELSLGLSSSQDVIAGGQLMDSADSWNRFEDRKLLLFLSDDTDTKRVSIFGTVGPVQAVPEPSPVSVLVALGLFFALTYAGRK